MAKLKLNPAATFNHVVHIPVAGAEPAAVQIAYKWANNKRVKAFSERMLKEKITDQEGIMEIVAGWDLDEPFNAENVGLLLENYPLAGVRIIEGYYEEVYNARSGN